MRRAALLCLCSMAPGAVLAACFSQSSSSIPDSGITELPETSTPVMESDVPEASEPDVTVEAGPPPDDAVAPDVYVADGTVDAAIDAPVDAPVDAPPTGSFTTSLIDFGLVNCGSAPAQTATYTFTNTGTEAITYSASAGTGTIFSIQGTASGTIAPGDTGTITLQAGTVPATSTAGTALTGTLTLTTNVPGANLISVPLQVTPQGGTLTLTPATASFNPAELTVAAPDVPLTITNVGNASVDVALGTPSDTEFGISYTGGPNAVALGAGQSLPGAVATFTPSSPGSHTSSSAITATGVLCGTSATSIALDGSGTSESVTAGPTPLAFGTVNCGSQSSQVLPVTITNDYSFAINYSATLGTSYYSIDNPTGTVPGATGTAGTTIIHVTPKPIPATASIAAGAFDDTLTITTDAPDTSATPIVLDESAQGAILTLTLSSGPTAPANTNFGSVVAGSTGTLPFYVSNTGNVSAPITLHPSGAGVSAQFTGSSTAASGGGTASGNATFTPTAAGSVTGSLGISTSAATCAPIATATSLTGKGVGPVATYSSTPIALSVTCGAGSASNQAQLTITNDTAYPLTVDATSQNGHFAFVGNADLTIAAEGSGTLTIDTAAVPVGSMAGGTYDDAIVFTTNEFGNPTHTVPVDVTVVGANLAFTSPAQPEVTLCYTYPTYTISNTGNVDATVTVPSDATGGNPVNFGPFTTQDGGEQPASADVPADGSYTGTIYVLYGCGTQSDNFAFTTSGTICMGATLTLPMTFDIPCQPPCAC